MSYNKSAISDNKDKNMIKHSGYGRLVEPEKFDVIPVAKRTQGRSKYGTVKKK